MTHQSLDLYPSIISISVQWGDMDALGHVNNTVPIRWYESSRITYLETSGIAEAVVTLNVGPILAAVNCNYRRQLFYPDNVKVGGRVSRVGRSSITLEHVVLSERLGEVATDGESVMVIFDFDNQRPVRVPDEVREKIKDLQPNLVFDKS